MPIYEYRCQACGHEMELLQKIADEPLLQCPSCGEEQLRKLMSAAGFRLKGGGWYETDFKSSNKRNLATSNDTSKEKGDPGKAKDNQGGSVANSKPADTTSTAATS
jgi:putative FmdB family regulatory protein